MLEKIFFLTNGEYFIENQTHIGYGIGCFADGKNIVFEDLSADREKVQNFVDICNKLRLSQIHICDAVDDFLSDLE